MNKAPTSAHLPCLVSPGAVTDGVSPFFVPWVLLSMFSLHLPPRSRGSRASEDVRWTSIRRLQSSRACREPLYRSSYRFRLASWCEPFRRGANSLMDGEFDVHYEHARSWRRCLSYKTNYFLHFALMYSIPRIINVAFIAQ